MKLITRCSRDEIFTLQKNCPACGNRTATTVPAKFSLNDKYAQYRRAVKLHERKEAGLM